MYPTAHAITLFIYILVCHSTFVYFLAHHEQCRLHIQPKSGERYPVVGHVPSSLVVVK